MSSVLNALSFDVEDWYHIMEVPSAPRRVEWDGLPSHVEANTKRILDFLAKRDARATFFFLGYIAERYPGLVREVAKRGHEVACHGYAHDPVYTLSPEAFRDDLDRAVRAIEAAAGCRPQGYRAPGFSITPGSTWALGVIAEAGFRYDSSVFPAARLHGGLKDGGIRPHRLRLDGARMLDEFPISTVSFLGKRLAFSGGGYLRLFPKGLLVRWVAGLNAKGIPVIVYLHPREFDPAHPRLPMSPSRRFRSYVGLGSVETKLEALLGSFRFTTVRHALEAYGVGRPAEERRVGVP